MTLLIFRDGSTKKPWTFTVLCPSQKPAPSNGQGHPFTDPLQSDLSTQEGQPLSHSIPYQFPAAAEPPPLHVSAPENDSQSRRTLWNASPALQYWSRHNQLEEEGQLFSPLNSRAILRTPMWSRASDSQPRQWPDLSCSPPYTRHVLESTLNLSPSGSSPLHFA